MRNSHLLLFHLLTSMFTFAFAQSNLGPGQGKWTVDSPEKHGLSSNNLKLAGKNMEKLKERYCFLVAKDGVIVHEDYYGDTTVDTKYETDSAGKTVQAALLGVAENQGLYDLDTPLEKYGVKPQASWGKYWSLVTAKSLLSQTSGVGKVEPGKYFTYDSDAYIQHLSYLLTKVTPEKSALKFANKHFAKPMGFPHLYKYDNVNPEVSIGGGQFMTCREMARVGQLILNKGKWLDSSNKPYDMLSADFVHKWTTPQYPKIDSSYGFLTWLNTKPSAVKCCAPRWGYRKYCKGNHLDTSIIGDDVEDALTMNCPYDVSVALGWLGKYLITIPSRNMVVVTMGESWGSSSKCDAGGGGYDDSYTLTEVWKAFGNLTISSDLVNQSSLDPQQTDTDRFDLGQTNQSSLSHNSVMDPVTNMVNHKNHKPNINVDVEVSGPITGACYCYCPPSQGFGQCYNIRNNTERNAHECDAAYQDGARICPYVAVVRELTSSGSRCDKMRISSYLKCKSGETDSLNQTAESCPCHVTRFETCTYYDGYQCDGDDPYTPTNGTL